MAATTKAKVAALTGLAEADIQDDWLTWVEDLLQQYLGAPFGTATATDVLDGKDRDVVFLSKRLVTGVTSVKVFGVALAASAYRLYGGPGYIRMVSQVPFTPTSGLLPAVFPAGAQNVEVQYTYDNPVTPRVEAAATQMVALIARTAKAGLLGTGGVSYRVGEVSVTNAAQVKLHDELVGIMKSMLGKRPLLGGFKAARLW
jgi:hypothetical protein